jgi:transketolase
MFLKNFILASAAEIVSTLFFHEMRYDPKNPKDVNADRFVLSKGHGKLKI